MYGLFSILILITCALLLLVILVQNPKGVICIADENNARHLLVELA